MGSGISKSLGRRDFVHDGQVVNSAPKHYKTNTAKNISPIKHVEEDTDSSKPQTSQPATLDRPGVSNLCSVSKSDDDEEEDDDLRKHLPQPPISHSNLEFYSSSWSNIGAAGVAGIIGEISAARHKPTEISQNMGEGYHWPTSYACKTGYHKPHAEKKKISTVNDIHAVKSMVEKLLPCSGKDKIQIITDSICEFEGIPVLESDEHSRSIVFVYDKYKLSISVDTVVELVERGCLREVDLLLPETELPDLTGKSRMEILDILASGGGIDHENLIISLQKRDIEHIVSPYTKNIFVRNFTEHTISKIGELACELQINLTISGGGPCEYLMFADNPTDQLLSALSTQEYQQQIANSIRNSVPVRNAKIGVIDSGCTHALYQQLIRRDTVVMHNRMISAVNASRATETDYNDCFVNANRTGHGTGVVEIIANCVLSGTEICVANVGYPFSVSNVECALMELFKRDMNVLNCSFFVDNSRNLARTLKAIKSVGVIVVAAVGNFQDFIDTGLNDGSTILVGSHNDQNSISAFSTAKCMANICSLGEGVEYT